MNVDWKTELQESLPFVPVDLSHYLHNTGHCAHNDELLYRGLPEGTQDADGGALVRVGQLQLVDRCEVFTVALVLLVEIQASH